MRRMLFLLVASLIFIGTSAFAANPIGGKRDWNVMIMRPDLILQKFRGLPQTNVGHFRVVYVESGKIEDPLIPKGLALVAADIREKVVIFYYRGIDGGPVADLNEENIIEVRWKCGLPKWCVWNSELSRSLFSPPLYKRPGLQPQAENAPF